MFLSVLAAIAFSQTKVSPAAEAILKRVSGLRALPEAQRPTEITELAHAIDRTTEGNERVMMASLLASQVTEGDAGKTTEQAVADTLADALRHSPQPPEQGGPAYAYTELANLETYEGLRVRLQGPEMQQARKAVQEDAIARAKADFSLTDLGGKTWRLGDLKGKVVLLNFWATWCPPCRKEMPDLQKLYSEFADKGLIVLAVSDEDASKVRDFAQKAGWTFPVLLDPGRTVNKTYRVESIPKTFLYDRRGKLVATAIDMRTREQFLRMFSRVDLK